MKHVVFSTSAEERKHVIFQIGTTDAVLATQAALSVCRDVRGIDINMGCTQPFTAQGGMGAKLLDKPDIVADILKSLRRELPPECALSCKIRMLSSMDRTRDFMQMCERSGANAIAVHMRTRDEDIKFKKDVAHWESIDELCDAVSVPVIANGDFLIRSHISQFWEQRRVDEDRRKGPAAILVARGAIWDPAIFYRGSDAEKPSCSDVVSTYIHDAVRTNTTYDNTKWVLKQMFSHPSSAACSGKQGKQLKNIRHRLDMAKDMVDICDLIDEVHDPSMYPVGSHSHDFGCRALEQLELSRGGYN